MSSFFVAMKGDKEILATIGQNIRKIRNSQGYTQSQVEVGCKLAEGNLSLIELGQVEIGILKAVRIAAFLQVPLSDFYEI